MSLLAFTFGMPGTTELLIIFGLLIFLFGAQKLPKMCNSLGRSLFEFKKGAKEVEQEIHEVDRKLKS